MGKEEQKEEKKEFVAPVYTGQGFIPLDELVDCVKAWQQRKVLCEDVDYLEKKGGRNR